MFYKLKTVTVNVNSLSLLNHKIQEALNMCDGLLLKEIKIYRIWMSRSWWMPWYAESWIGKLQKASKNLAKLCWNYEKISCDGIHGILRCHKISCSSYTEARLLVLDFYRATGRQIWWGLCKMSSGKIKLLVQNMDLFGTTSTVIVNFLSVCICI